jgi:hypothetical protein
MQQQQQNYPGKQCRPAGNDYQGGFLQRENFIQLP